MGDYCKLIVSCTVKGVAKEKIEEKVKELGLGYSSYQSNEYIVHIKSDPYARSEDELQVILVGQTKYGQGQNEFCKWIRPYVKQGSGLHDVFALSFSEYSDEPQIWKKYEKPE